MTHAFMGKIVTVGAKGYIGKPLFEKALTYGTSIGITRAGESNFIKLDLGRSFDFSYQEFSSGDAFLFTAAISAPDICENQYELARAVNVTATIEFLEQIISRGARVLFFSTDAVYGECLVSADESTATRPSGKYAAMKCEVEDRFAGEACFKSIRLSYVFSAEDKFTKYLEGCASRSEVAEVFHPFSRAIVHRGDVVDGALALVQRWKEFPQPVINFGGPEVVSRLQFAEHFKNIRAPLLDYKIFEPDDAFFKNRPRTIAMKSDILPALLRRPARSLSEAMSLEFKKA